VTITPVDDCTKAPDLRCVCTIRVGELQIRNTIGDVGGLLIGLRESLPVEPGEPHEAGAATRDDVVGRAVTAEECGFVVVVRRNQRGDAPRHPRMAGERAVLGPRQLEPGLELDAGGRQHGGTGRTECESGVTEVHGFDVHGFDVYVSELTAT
jgi:hypothetical protein